ncbi:MAG TPA: AfsR family transcriptional regulator [Micromonosporaceae bacterium]|nr:AfsR family transcriptional regulator [Micromonosporaceae bacterium]
MEFRLLGAVEAVIDGTSVPLGGAKPRTLLAALLLENGRVIPATRLIHVIWGDDPPETARALIQTYVSTLRQAFTKGGMPGLITTQSPGYVISAPAGSIDREAFEALLAAGRESAIAGQLEQSANQLRAAESLWRGPALSGLEHSLLAGEAARLEELRLTAIDERIAADLALGRHDSLVSELTVLVDRHPTNERLRGRLMLALYRLGRQAEALACYRDCREALIEELGLEPGAELKSLHSSILRGEADLVGGATRSHSGVPAQLPHATADFTGRASETAALIASLTSTTASVPTQVISGPGGTGKSTLAAHVAHQVALSFPDGQLYAELRGMSDAPVDAGAVLGRFLRRLGVEAAEVPESTDERAELYRTLLAGRRMLIVLDDTSTEQQVRPLLPGNRSCATMITSRARLAGLSGVDLTELDVLDSESAVELLGRLAGPERVAKERGAAERIVAHCANLPLAIRISGARLAGRRRMPLPWLADRLADESERLNELAAGDLGVRASIGLSYDALEPDQQRLLRRLGFFGVPHISSWTAAWLCGLSELEAERLLELLVDAQLVTFMELDEVGRVRYRLHDLVRIFARERAVAEEPADILNASVAEVLGGWLALISQITADSPPEEISWQHTAEGRTPVADTITRQAMAAPRAWFTAEQSALAAGVERASILGLHALACEFASARYSTVFVGANRFEIRTRISEAAFAAARQAGDRRSEAIMLAERGQLRYDQDHYAEARQQFGEALSIFRELEDKHGQAAALAGLGLACREPGHLVESLHFLDQATKLLEPLGDDIGIGYTRRLSGSVRLEQGDYPAAREDLDKSLQAYLRAGSKRGEGCTLRTFGLYHRARGELDQAVQTSSRAADIFRELGDDLMEAYAVRAAAKAQLRQGRLDEALPALEGSLATSRAAGDRWGQGATLRVLGELHLVEGRLDLAGSCLKAAMEVWETMDVPLWRARTERDMALLSELSGDQEQAQVLRKRAAMVFRDHGAREYRELKEAYRGL